MGKFIVYNGKLVKENEPVILGQSRGLRYGDGFFETIKTTKGHIHHKDLHFDRILKTMHILHFEFSRKFSLDAIELNLNKLLIKNDHLKDARVRITFLRKNGGLYDDVKNVPDYIIETAEINFENKLNSNGLILGIYSASLKSCDELSELKTNNFLPYAMAAFEAKKHKWNDCLLLNMHRRIADTTIANIFLIKNDVITTPSLTEACVAGVTRRFLLQSLKDKYNITEAQISVSDLYAADEVFLTNAIRGIRWVKSIDDHSYGNKRIREIYNFVNRTN